MVCDRYLNDDGMLWTATCRHRRQSPSQPLALRRLQAIVNQTPAIMQHRRHTAIYKERTGSPCGESTHQKRNKEIDCPFSNTNWCTLSCQSKNSGVLPCAHGPGETPFHGIAPFIHPSFARPCSDLHGGRGTWCIQYSFYIYVAHFKMHVNKQRE